jgi:hypothetical protein
MTVYLVKLRNSDQNRGKTFNAISKMTVGKINHRNKVESRIENKPNRRVSAVFFFCVVPNIGSSFYCNVIISLLPPPSPGGKE